MIKLCKNCDRPFKALTNKYKYCSERCYKIFWAKERKEQVAKFCLYCKKEYATARSQSKYCSAKCRIAAAREKSGIVDETKMCPVCGRIFITGKTYQKYCRYDCYYEVNAIRTHDRYERKKNAKSTIS